MGNANVSEGAGHGVVTPSNARHPPLADAAPLSPPHSAFVAERQQLPSHPVASYHRQGESARLNHAASSESMGHSPPDSPESTACSPLMFTPQIPMIPISKTNEPGMGPYLSQSCDLQGSDKIEREQAIPILVQWNHGGNEIFVEGSWDDWSTRVPLQKVGKDFTLVKLLPSGVYQYRFVVNGERRYAPDLPCIYDQVGNINNVIDVHDYVPENLENIAGFEPPRSPDASYDDPFP
eukprot:c25001_g1_i1 orf=81-788(+)